MTRPLLRQCLDGAVSDHACWQVPPFKATLMEAMPYIDFLFGNETEAAAFAATESWPDKELSAIALRIAAFPKASGQR